MDDKKVNPAANVSEQSQGKVKVLIVEDEPDAVTIFKNLLETDPKYEVYDSPDGVDALEKLTSKDFDMVLMDIIMPKMDGIEALKQIKANPDKYGDPLVIMLTNVGGDQAVKDSEKYDADGFILKIEIEPKELLEKIEGYTKMRLESKSGVKETEAVEAPETPEAA